MSRSPGGDGFQWISDDTQLDERQRTLLRTQRSCDSVWTDEETGLEWIFDTARLPHDFSQIKGMHVEGHSDWRTPTVSDLKTLRGVAKNECGAYVKPSVIAKLTGAYACSTAIRKGCHDDGMTWNFTTDSVGEVKYREGKIRWGTNGEYAGFEEDRKSGEGANIYVRGERSDRMSEWCESLVRWAEENDYHDFPVTTDTILALDVLRLNGENPPPYLSRLQSLRKIDVYKGKTLPPELLLLKNLEELQWRDKFPSDEEHCVLPAEVGALTSLISLKLEGVKLDELPSSLGELTNLRQLHLVRTNLERLPESIGQLRNLEKLVFKHNGLKALPATVKGLTGLRHLTISDRCLIDMPDCFGHLTKLESLVLDWTPLETLPKHLGDLIHLEELSVIRCGLTVLPSWIPEMKALRSLNVSFNRIHTLPQGIGKLCELETLSIAATLVDELPEELGQLDKLRHLNISGTPLKTLPEWISNMVNLTNIMAAKLWHIKRLSRYEGKTIGTYFGAFDQADGREWLQSLGWPGR